MALLCLSPTLSLYAEDSIFHQEYSEISDKFDIFARFFFFGKDIFACFHSHSR